MAISANEQMNLTCVACAEPFTTEVWSAVDAGERPDLAQALLDGSLNVAACPHCGASNQAQIALLFHDSERRRVYFAVPSDVAEHRWREQAQALLYALVGELPEEARLPYLGDVQVEQEIAGVQRSVLRRQRARQPGTQPSFGKPIVLPGMTETSATIAREPRRALSSPEPMATRLIESIELVLGASSIDELRALVLRVPQLLSEDADLLLRQLAETAFNQGDRDTATAVHAARTTLNDLRAGRDVEAPALATTVPDVSMAELALVLPDSAYQALLHTASDAALIEAIRMFPALLEPWADDDLVRREEAALDEGNERLATLIDDRRDALGTLRFALTDAEPLERAVEALLAATSTDAFERVLLDHPALLTDAALQTLAAVATRARAQGDLPMASAAESRAAMLDQVRAGVEAA